MTSPPGEEKLAGIAADPARSAILLDFDGTLAPIVTWPEEAELSAGAREVLSSLAGRFLLVAVISGRPVDALERLVDVPGVRCEGLYGLASSDPVDDSVDAEVRSVASAVPGAWVEAKGVTVAVHYRQAEDPARARDALAPGLEAVARRGGFDLLEGKMVFELAPAGESRKGGVVKRLVRESRARAALYAGDDLPDLEAFAALDELAKDGLAAVKVAVASADDPDGLTSAADIVVSGPQDLVALLRSLC